MIKFVRQKSRDNSVAKGFLKKKSESNDSGTESDGEIIDVENNLHLNTDLDMETPSGSCSDAASPIGTSAMMMCQSHLLCDQHSSEEELEVINGPSSVAAAAAAAGTKPHSSSSGHMRGTSSLRSGRNSSSLDMTEAYGNENFSSKRASSTQIENRKRSLVHSSDDELRSHLEPVLTPVNFRTTPPLEAFKPNRSHKFRSSTPLILSEARRGIENMKLCDETFNAEEAIDGEAASQSIEQNNGSVINKTLKTSNSSHIIYQPLTTYSYHYNSSRSSPASTSGLDLEVRSVSPPAKLFHCAKSPKRRPVGNKMQQQQANSSASYATQRQHRPCLDFDKMQQVSLH